MATSPHGQERVYVTWYALAAGMMWWGVHLAGSAALVPYSCHVGSAVWLHLLSVVTAALVLHAMSLAWRTWRADDVGEGVAFLGAIGVFVCLTGLAAIFAEWLPVFMIDVCAG